MSSNRLFAAEDSQIEKLGKGVIDSGGGGAFYCPAEHSPLKTPSVHLLDLWEAENVHNLKLNFSNEDEVRQFNRAVDILGIFDSGLPSEIKRIANQLFSNMEPIKRGVRLSPPTDAVSAYEMENCPLRGILYYDGLKRRLMYDPQLYPLLATATDRAAARLHEAWYFLVRREAKANFYNPPFAMMEIAKNSILTRRLVGCLFSENPYSCLGSRESNSIVKEMPTAELLLSCRNDRTATKYWSIPHDNSDSDEKDKPGKKKQTSAYRIYQSRLNHYRSQGVIHFESLDGRRFGTYGMDRKYDIGGTWSSYFPTAKWELQNFDLYLPHAMALPSFSYSNGVIYLKLYSKLVGESGEEDEFGFWKRNYDPQYELDSIPCEILKN